MHLSEAVTRRYSVKYVLLEISQNSQETPVLEPRPATLLKKKLWHRCFPVNLAKFLRTPFLTEHLPWLLLTYNFKWAIDYHLIWMSSSLKVAGEILEAVSGCTLWFAILWNIFETLPGGQNKIAKLMFYATIIFDLQYDIILLFWYNWLFFHWVWETNFTKNHVSYSCNYSRPNIL